MSEVKRCVALLALRCDTITLLEAGFMSRLGIALLSVLGFLLILRLSLNNDYFRTKNTDFKIFYAGARLAGSPQLYDSRMARQVFYYATGRRPPDWANHIVFSRMPWVAEAL